MTAKQAKALGMLMDAYAVSSAVRVWMDERNHLWADPSRERKVLFCIAPAGKMSEHPYR